MKLRIEPPLAGGVVTVARDSENEPTLFAVPPARMQRFDIHFAVMVGDFDRAPELIVRLVLDPIAEIGRDVGDRGQAQQPVIFNGQFLGPLL